MARRISDLNAGPFVVVTNPGEDCSPQAFRALHDELAVGPEPVLESIDAVDALRQLRVDAGG